MCLYSRNTESQHSRFHNHWEKKQSWLNTYIHINTYIYIHTTYIHTLCTNIHTLCTYIHTNIHTISETIHPYIRYILYNTWRMYVGNYHMPNRKVSTHAPGDGEVQICRIRVSSRQGAGGNRDRINSLFGKWLEFSLLVIRDRHLALVLLNFITVRDLRTYTYIWTADLSGEGEIVRKYYIRTYIILILYVHSYITTYDIN